MKFSYFSAPAGDDPDANVECKNEFQRSRDMLN